MTWFFQTATPCESSDCYRLYLKLLDQLASNRIIVDAYRTYEKNSIRDQLRQGVLRNHDDLIPTGNQIRGAYAETFDHDEHKGIMAHLEKMLFMMKGHILKEYDPSIKCVFEI